MKKFRGLLILSLILILSLGISNDLVSAESPEDNLSANEVLKELKVASDEVTNNTLSTRIEVYSNSRKPVSVQESKIYAFYLDNSYDVDKAFLHMEDSNEDGTQLNELVYLYDDGGAIYTRVEEDGEWNHEGNYESFALNPDYFELIQIMDQLGDDLQVEERDDAYILSLSSNKIDLVGLFRDQYNLEFEGIDGIDMDKDLQVTIDKESHLMTQFHLVLDYSGEDGDLKMDINSNYHDFNETDEIVIPSVGESQNNQV